MQLGYGWLGPRFAIPGSVMGKFGFVPYIELLAPDEWHRLRDIRLSALRESPHAFLAKYDDEQAYSESQWRAEFARGDWHIGLIAGRPVSLLGITREPGAPAQERFLEYLWVSPDRRRSGVARSMLSFVIEGLRTSGVTTIFLWVLDGNAIAIDFYKKVGFARSNHRQPLPEDPERSEELMRLDLG
jgi:ribosomal protein S18 acetylase RimI-like enzyme